MHEFFLLQDKFRKARYTKHSCKHILPLPNLCNPSPHDRSQKQGKYKILHPHIH